MGTMVSHLVTSTIDDLNPFVWRPDVAPAGGDIDIDNDGVMQHRIVCDLSGAISQVIGKQCNQHAIYRINYISIHLENRDDVVDNSSAANFGGQIQFFKPNAHNINAMQVMRTIDRERRKELFSREGGLFNQKTGGTRYTSPRYNWSTVDAKVVPAVEGMSVWSDANLGDYPALEPLLTIYAGSMLKEGQPDYENELWSRRTGLAQKMHWSASYRNTANEYFPESQPFVWQSQGNDLECLAGLMQITIDHSSTDAPEVVDDDYVVYVTVGVSGWEAF